MTKTKNALEGAKMHKNFFIFLIVGMLALSFVSASSLTNNQLTTGNLTLTSSLLKMTANDALIKLTAYNSAVYQNLQEIAGALWINQSRPEAKGGVLWTSWDNASSSYLPTGWIVTHYNSSINGNVHSHLSFETLDNVSGTPALNTKLEFNYGSDLKQTGNRLTYAKFSNIDRLILGSGVAIQSINPFDIYANNQKSIGLRVTNDTSLVLSALGTTDLKFSGDNVTISELAGTGNAFACLDSNGKLYRSATACA